MALPLNSQNVAVEVGRPSLSLAIWDEVRRYRGLVEVLMDKTSKLRDTCKEIVVI